MPSLKRTRTQPPPPPPPPRFPQPTPSPPRTHTGKSRSVLPQKVFYLIATVCFRCTEGTTRISPLILHPKWYCWSVAAESDGDAVTAVDQGDAGCP